VTTSDATAPPELTPPRRNRTKAHLETWLPRYLAVALLPALAGVWMLVTSLELVSPALFPELDRTVEAFENLVTSDGFARHLGRTAAEIAIGFGIGALIGFALGLTLAASPLLRKAYFPLVSGFVSIPYVVFTPVAITWFGFGIGSKIAIAVLISFFPVLITTLVGLEAATEPELRLMRSLQASRRQIFFEVRLKNALPAIFGGLKIAMTLAIVGAIVGEFIGSDAGLGYLLLAYRAQFDVATVFAIIALFAIIATVSFTLLELVERRVVFWKHHE
jgi:NitT/TauT family transport system permease protein